MKFFKASEFNRGILLYPNQAADRANELINERCYTYECDRTGKMLKVIEEIEEDSLEKVLKDILHYNKDQIGPVFVERAEKLLKGETK